MTKVVDRRVFYPKHVLFREGDPGDRAYLIVSGEVVIVKNTPNGRTVLATLGANALFGEMALIDGAPRMASAVTTKTTVCVIVHRNQVQEMLKRADARTRTRILFMIDYVRKTMPYTERRKNGELVIDTPADEMIREVIDEMRNNPPPDYPTSFIRALDELLLQYVHRRLPPVDPHLDKP